MLKEHKEEKWCVVFWEYDAIDTEDFIIYKVVGPMTFIEACDLDERNDAAGYSTIARMEEYYNGKVSREQTQTLKALGFRPVVRGGERVE